MIPGINMKRFDAECFECARKTPIDQTTVKAPTFDPPKDYTEREPGCDDDLGYEDIDF